jgi:hypothetical protein
MFQCKLPEAQSQGRYYLARILGHWWDRMKADRHLLCTVHRRGGLSTVPCRRFTLRLQFGQEAKEGDRGKGRALGVSTSTCGISPPSGFN